MLAFRDYPCLIAGMFCMNGILEKTGYVVTQSIASLPVNKVYFQLTIWLGYAGQRFYFTGEL